MGVDVLIRTHPVDDGAKLPCEFLGYFLEFCTMFSYSVDENILKTDIEFVQWEDFNWTAHSGVLVYNSSEYNVLRWNVWHVYTKTNALITNLFIGILKVLKRCSWICVSWWYNIPNEYRTIWSGAQWNYGGSDLIGRIFLFLFGFKNKRELALVICYVLFTKIRGFPYYLLILSFQNFCF